MTYPKLYHFRPGEFRGWNEQMDVRLLVLLDAFRNCIEAPVVISPVPGALGRNNGPDDGSQHNVDRWGEVRAVDVILESLQDQDTAERYVAVATRLGFTGVGVYPDWQPHPGMHLDVRRGTVPGSPAIWGMVRDSEESPQRAVSLNEAISKFQT